MTGVDRQDFFYPDLQVKVGEYVFTEGISVEIYSDRNKPCDWGRVKFTEEYQPEITLTRLSDITVSLGYNGILQDVFIGTQTKTYNGSGKDEILFKDYMYKLEQTAITASFKDCTPQDIIREGLAAAGINKMHLSDSTYPAKKLYPVYSKNVVQLLKQINAAWGIDNRSYFIKGEFFWGVTPEQGDVLEFEYGSNIISMGKDGDLWELETISVPSMQHSQKISVVHPKITGEFEAEKVVFRTNDAGFIRTTIYFKGE